MSRTRGHYHRNRQDRRHDAGSRNKPVVGEKTREVLEGIDPDSPVLKSFQQYAAELDSKHDKYERIVKISRDITIESKRIIFLLHTLDRESKKEDVLKEAMKRITQVERAPFKEIAKELKGEDPYLYHKAYTAGLQEYVEALTFYHYLKNNKLQNWSHIQEKLQYAIPFEKSEEQICENQDQDTETTEQKSNDSIKTLVPQADYILGVADLTGELMRKCINNLGFGQVDSCFQTCSFVKEIYNGFLCIGNSGPRECSRKLYTLRQSLSKMENACYTIHVRGSEIPKYMLIDVLNEKQDEYHEEDEGFY